MDVQHHGEHRIRLEGLRIQRHGKEVFRKYCSLKKVNSNVDRYKINYYLAKKWGLQDIVDSDGDGEMDATDLTLGSFVLNNPPNISSVPLTNVNEKETFTYDIESSDLDGDPITLSIDGLPGAVISDNGDGSGSVTWTPSAVQVGEYSGVIIAFDGKSESRQEFNIRVQNVDNDPPVSIGLSNTTISGPIPDNILIGSLSALDPDGISKVYSLVSGDGDDDNRNFNILNSKLYSAEAIDTAGTQSIRLQVSDGQYVYSDSFTITVGIEDADSDGLADYLDLAPNDASITAMRPDFTNELDKIFGKKSKMSVAESSMRLWLDASNINGRYNNGLSSEESISTWVDLSGTQHNVMQDTEAHQPSISTELLNGLNVINFDGVDDSLKTETLMELKENSMSIFAVIKLEANRTDDEWQYVVASETNGYLVFGSKNDDFASLYGDGSWKSIPCIKYQYSRRLCTHFISK